MNKQKEEILKILISAYVGDESMPKISLREAAYRLATREDQAEKRGYRSGASHATAIAMAVAVVIWVALALFDTTTSPASLPPADGIILDTTLENHSEIPGSVRQASPELQKAYDSSVRAEGRDQQ